MFLLSYIFYNKAKPSINKQYWKYAFNYSWPIVPHGISQVLLSQFDRIMIRSLVGITEVGLYSLPGSLKSILLIIVESLSTTWTTWVYEKLEKNNVEKIQYVSKLLMMIFVILTVGMLSLIPELIYILGGTAYNDSKYVAIPIIIEAFVIALYNIVVPIEYYTKKTHFIMLGTMLAGVLNVVLNYFCIKKYGYVAAAYTTLFAYLCYLLFHTLISYHLVKFNILHIGVLIFGFIIVIFSAIMNYLFIENIIVRYILCMIIVIPILLYLYRCGGFKNNGRF